ncbi:MAG: hypothetical protein KGJ69_01065 [Thermoplasmata archaeon]|nr:hypothetical protein [Thermoplasmata archaeon]
MEQRIGLSPTSRPGLRTRDLSSGEVVEGPRLWVPSAPTQFGSFLSEGNPPAPIAPRGSAYPAVAPNHALQAADPPLRLHFYQVVRFGERPQLRAIELPSSVMDEPTRRTLSHSLLKVGNGLNLFLTLPDRSNGLLTPADPSLRTYTTVPLELGSDRLVRYRAPEVLRLVAQAHRVAQRELEQVRDHVGRMSDEWIREALFAPISLPEAALFTAPVEGELWRNLQGGFPQGARLAFTPGIPGLVRRWWQVGDTQLLRTTSQGLRSDLLDGTLRGLRARFQTRPGSLVAFEGVEGLLRTLPLPEVERMLHTVRDEAIATNGCAWVSWDPNLVDPETQRLLGRGFSVVPRTSQTAWTIAGVGEDARLVPLVVQPHEPETPRMATTLGAWLATSKSFEQTLAEVAASP